MRKKFFLFNLILTILLTINSNLVYSEPIESEEGESKENSEGEPYRRLAVSYTHLTLPTNSLV